MRTFRGNTSWLALIGAGFFWAWLDSVVARPTLFEPFGTMQAMNPSYIAVYAISLIPIIVALIAPRKVDRFTAKPHFGPSVGAVASAGCFAMVAGGLLASPVLMTIGTLLVGFELGALLLIWGRVCVCQGSFHALLHIVGAYACSLFVDLLIVYLQPVPAAIFLSLCPLISCALFWVLATKTADGKELELGSSSTEDDFPMDVAPQHPVRFDAQVILIILGFYAVLGFASFVNNPATMNASLTLFYSLAWEIAGFLLFLLCALRGWKARKVSAFGITMFALAAVAALLPLSQDLVHGTSGSLLSAGCVAFDVLCWSLVSLSHHFTRRPYIGTVAIVAACQQAGTLVGYTIGEQLPQSSADPATYATIVIVLSVLLIAGTVYAKLGNKMLVTALFSDTGAQTHADGERPSPSTSPDALSYATAPAATTPHDGNPPNPLVEEKPLTTEPEKTADRQNAPAPKKGAKHRNPAKPLLPHKRHLGQTTEDLADERSSAEKIEELSERFGLTRREREVFGQLSMGRSAPYIAEVYQVSENTVRSHIKHIYTKMGVHSRQELLTLVSKG